MPNRLIQESSPYLRQHAHNPVDWYPWGEEAWARARDEDRPVFLSIGYSACHWCHVMEHESFEDQATAVLMNEMFINIKVDREERPDLDQIYMTAVQGMTGHGGWPMSVWLTPEGKPFYGGTYFPPSDRGGMPAFRRVLAGVYQAYKSERTRVVEQADHVAAFIQQHTLLRAEATALDASVLDDAAASLGTGFDPENGGFGTAPKFPQAMALDFLLAYAHRTGSAAALPVVESTLVKMALGGIYDQIGGGFHRYSVDAHWLVPHFEKMLYDNALLARSYLHAYQATGSHFYRRVVEDSLDYVKREMLAPSGGFYSTQDADSEGVEGKYFVWTPTELADAVGAENARAVARYFGVTAGGNFEGKTILTAPGDPEAVAAELGLSLDELGEIIGRARARMLEVRQARVPPSRDDKILTGWNGLMLRAFAEAARTLARPDDLGVAVANGRFILDQMWQGGRLLRVHKDGQSKIPGYLEDYAGAADGLLALYEATYELKWFEAATEIAAAMIDRFWEDGESTFFDAARDAEGLIARPRDVWDNATPSGTSLACQVLLRLWAYTGQTQYERLPRTVLSSAADFMRQNAVGLGHLLSALELLLAPPTEIAIIGEPSDQGTRRLLDTLRVAYLPTAVTACAAPGDSRAAAAIPLLRDRGLAEGKAAAYVCHGFVCDLPITEPEELLRALGAPATRGP